MERPRVRTDGGVGIADDIFREPPPAPVRALLQDFLARVATTLGSAVEGVVLFGSLAAGGFDPATSDVDLLVALSEEVDDAALERLRGLHAQLASAHPEWEDRVDVVYASTATLQGFRKHEGPLVVISRGEPLHRSRTDPGWLMNWHSARETGVALAGAPPRDLIAVTTQDEFLAAVRFYVTWLLARAESSGEPELCRYAVVSFCRALHACATGEQAAKREAALWAEHHYPEWSKTIRAARERRGVTATRGSASATPLSDALEFLRFAAREVTDRA